MSDPTELGKAIDNRLFQEGAGTTLSTIVDLPFKDLNLSLTASQLVDNDDRLTASTLNVNIADMVTGRSLEITAPTTEYGAQLSWMAMSAEADIVGEPAKRLGLMAVQFVSACVDLRHPTRKFKPGAEDRLIEAHKALKDALATDMIEAIEEAVPRHLVEVRSVLGATERQVVEVAKLLPETTISFRQVAERSNPDSLHFEGREVAISTMAKEDVSSTETERSKRFDVTLRVKDGTPEHQGSDRRLAEQAISYAVGADDFGPKLSSTFQKPGDIYDYKTTNAPANKDDIERFTRIVKTATRQ